MPESQPRNLRVVREITRQEILLSVDRVPNSDRLLVCGSAGKVHELSTAANAPAPTQLAEHGRYVNCVRRAGHYVVSGGYDNKLVWWNLVTQRIERTTDAHSRCVNGLEMSVARSLMVAMPRAASAAKSSARRSGKPALIVTLMWNRKCVVSAGMAASTASTESS